VLVRLHVVLPEPPFLRVRERELPILRRLVEPAEEAALLLPLGEVEEELPDERPVPGEVALEGVDVLEALLPNLLGLELGRDLLPPQDLGVDACDQDLLVVGTVEDPDAAALRETARRAPHEVVVQLLGRRRLERMDLAPL